MLGHFQLNQSPLLGVNTPATDYRSLPSYNQSIVTAVSHLEQGLSVPKFVIGGRGGGARNYHALFKKSTTHQFNLFRSQRFVVGKAFNLIQIELSLTSPISSGMSIVPVLHFDNDERKVVGTTINSTNYPNSENSLTLTAYSFNSNVHGNKDFYLELQFWGTALIGISLPVRMIIETEDVG